MPSLSEIAVPESLPTAVEVIEAVEEPLLRRLSAAEDRIEPAEPPALRTTISKASSGEKVEPEAKSETTAEPPPEPKGDSFVTMIKGIIAGLTAKPEDPHAEAQQPELVATVDAETGEQKLVVKTQEELEMITVKEKIADVIDLVVSKISLAPDIRLIFMAELLFVLFWIAVWPPFVQNIGVAIVFPFVLFGTALISFFWQRPPDGIPDLPKLRVPAELPEDLAIRVKAVKEKTVEMEELTKNILQLQDNIRALYPSSEAISVKLDTIFRILDSSEMVLHEELLAIPEDFVFEETDSVVPAIIKKNIVSPRRAVSHAPPVPKDMTAFFEKLFHPQKARTSKNQVHAVKKKKASSTTANAPEHTDGANPVAVA